MYVRMPPRCGVCAIAATVPSTLAPTIQTPMRTSLIKLDRLYRLCATALSRRRAWDFRDLGCTIFQVRITLTLRVRPTLAWFPLARPGCDRLGLIAGAFMGNDVAKELPGLSLEASKPHRLKRIVVRRACIHFDAVNNHRQLDILEAGRLLHDVSAYEVVAALLQHDLNKVGHRVPVGIAGIV